MVRKARSRPLNPQLHKKRWKELQETDGSGTAKEIFARIGSITSSYEMCESLFYHFACNLTSDADLMNVIFGHLNSRSTRVQLIEEYLETRKPRRPNKRFASKEKLLARFKAAGAKRDQVAHCALVEWRLEGKTLLILQPSSHIERKRVGALPTYHFDLPALNKIRAEIAELNDDLLGELAKIGQRWMQRQIRQKERADERSRAKIAPQSQH